MLLGIYAYVDKPNAPKTMTCDDFPVRAQRQLSYGCNVERERESSIDEGRVQVSRKVMCLSRRTRMTCDKDKNKIRAKDVSLIAYDEAVRLEL